MLKKELFPIRIFRHSMADYYSGDLNNVNQYYTSVFFNRLIENGFNGFWLQLKIRDLVPFRDKMSPLQKRNLSCLLKLARTAKKHGVSVYLYMNEPRALVQSDPFWKRFPESKGELGKSIADYNEPTYAICTSSEIGKCFIRECSKELVRQVPELAGVFLITASEHHTHCYSHVIIRPGITFASDQEHHGISCSRCKKRSATEVVAEVINLFRDGVREAGSRAAIIAWNWSWAMYAVDPQTDILHRLKKDILVMADFERGGSKIIGEKKRTIDEYSLSYIGPSPRFSKISHGCQRFGHKLVAKLQVNTTHELATVPNLPLLGHVYNKLSRLRAENAEGFLGCWNFGCQFTINTFAVKMFLNRGSNLKKEEFLAYLAEEYFGNLNTTYFLRAISGFEMAFNYYPFHSKFLYFGPINYALAVPLYLTLPQDKTPLTVSCFDLPRGNDWDSSLGNFSIKEIIFLLSSMCYRWGKAFAIYSKVLFIDQGFCPHEWGKHLNASCILLGGTLLDDRARLEHLRQTLPHHAIKDIPILNTIHGLHRLEEWACAYSILACIRSCLHLYQVHYLHRQKDGESKRSKLCQIVLKETELVKNMIPIMRLDARLGFHEECQKYLFDVSRLQHKLNFMKKEIKSLKIRNSEV